MSSGDQAPPSEKKSSANLSSFNTMLQQVNKIRSEETKVPKRMQSEPPGLPSAQKKRFDSGQTSEADLNLI